MTGRKPILICLYLLIMCLSIALCACGAQSYSGMKEGNGPDYNTLTRTGSMDLKYAECFTVDELGEYSLITIQDDKFLVVPENSEIPSKIPEDIVVLKQPINNVYQVSSSIMDMIVKIDAMDHFSFTATKTSDWHIDSVLDAVNQGKLTYAGKYSQPDYEMLLAKGCSLAIENTMILHNPETKEKLESLGIPVLIERSTYESHPLGRLEWIKLYGLLFGKSDEATTFYDDSLSQVEQVIQKESTGKSVAFFYVTSNGAVSVKKPTDYVAKMVGLAGGTYLPDAVEDEEDNAMSTINMTMEDFYAATKDADILIYNSTTVGDLSSLGDLLGKSPLFADYKAVKEGQVYMTGLSFFQKTTGVCDLITDINKVCEGDEDDLAFLVPLR